MKSNSTHKDFRFYSEKALVERVFKLHDLIAKELGGVSEDILELFLIRLPVKMDGALLKDDGIRVKLLDRFNKFHDFAQERLPGLIEVGSTKKVLDDTKEICNILESVTLISSSFIEVHNSIVFEHSIFGAFHDTQNDAIVKALENITVEENYKKYTEQELLDAFHLYLDLKDLSVIKAANTKYSYNELLLDLPRKLNAIESMIMIKNLADTSATNQNQ